MDEVYYCRKQGRCNEGGGGDVISTEGNTRALHFSPAPAGPDFFSSDASRACFRLLLILIF